MCDRVVRSPHIQTYVIIFCGWLDTHLIQFTWMLCIVPYREWSCPINCIEEINLIAMPWCAYSFFFMKINNLSTGSWIWVCIYFGNNWVVELCKEVNNFYINQNQITALVIYWFLSLFFYCKLERNILKIIMILIMFPGQTILISMIHRT